MSYIPNSAIPHAQAEPESSGPGWRQWTDEARALGDRALGLVRERPREAAAAGAAALLAAVGYAVWRGVRGRRSAWIG